jgi:hypothetical protein
MATRYYPAVKAPTAIVHGPAAGTWARQSAFGRSWDPVQWSWRLATTKVNAGTQSAHVLRTNQQGNYDFYFTRWMTPLLDAQTITGTIDLCTLVKARWDGTLGFTDQSIVRYKLHVYIANGQTPTVRHTLLNNYLDPVDFPGVAGAIWRSLTAPQTLTSGDALSGDVVVVELGFRVVSSPTPAPTYPPDDMTLIDWTGTGANAAFADAVAGDTSTSRAPWIEFSHTFTHLAAPAPPVNDACLDALVIASFPHTSAWIDTTESAGTEREVWWTWIASATAKACFHTFGSNYGATIALFTGSCAGLVAVPFPPTTSEFATHRSLASVYFNAVSGTQYWIRVRNQDLSTNAPLSGGLLRLSGFYVDRVPLENDLYLPAGNLVALRDGVLINLNPSFSSSAPTGVAIDYTKRSITDLNGGSHTRERILLGLHAFELVELLDLPTLSYGENQSEIDFIGDPWVNFGANLHPATLYITAAGLLHVGWFGDGYLYVIGLGALPAILNTISSNPDFSALKSIDAINADSQPGAPFADTLRYPAIEITAAWSIAVDEASNTLYYTSGGFYEPVGGALIKRFNLTTNTQLADFATLALLGTNNPGLKGLELLPDGGLLVCNGTVVQRLSAAGVISQTYTPSVALDSQSLCSVKLVADAQAFWVVDEPTTRLFKFDLSSGAELLTVQPYLVPGTLVQMAIYRPNGVAAAPPPCPIEFSTDVGGGPICAATLFP